MSTPTLFISAASVDLRPLRDQLHTAFQRAGFRVLTQEHSLSAAPGTVRRLLAEHIAESDCVLHLAGLGYGAHADRPFPEAPDFRCSWTQFEYYYAHQLKKDVIAFVCGSDLSTPGFQEKGEEQEIAEKRALQEAHRARVASGHFDGTPLAACAERPLNERVESHAKLLQCVAAAVGKLNRKDPAYDRVRDELLELQASLNRIEASQRRAHRLSRAAWVSTMAGLVALGVFGWWMAGSLRRHSEKSADRTAGQLAAAQVVITKQIRTESSSLAAAVDASSQTSTQIKQTVGEIDRKLSALPPAAPIFKLASTPSGARVLSPVSLQPLGVTPIPLGAATRTGHRIIVDQQGFRPVWIELPLDGTTDTVVALRAAAPPQEGTNHHCDLLREEFVWIPPGTGVIGARAEQRGSSAGERPPTSVVLSSGFWMAQHELTRAQAALFDQRAVKSSPKQEDALPATGMSWDDAVAYARALSAYEREAGRLPSGFIYSLPTEAEWEYACRAGSTTAFFTGEEEASVDRVGWHRENSQGTPHAVGEKEPNPNGLYDLYGNVEEWCLDWYGGYPGGAVRDYTGPRAGTQRVARGGSYLGIALRDSRSAARQRHAATERLPFVGMRLMIRRETLPANR